MSAFCFLDDITELKKNESVTAFFTLKGSEEFLLDHFKGFPVMPGVLLLESLKQASLALLSGSKEWRDRGFRLVEVSDVKFGQFIKPGSTIKVIAKLLKIEDGQSFVDGRIELQSQEGRSAKVLSAALTFASA